MKCPICDNAESKVIDSRPIEDGSAIRRRRECEHCKYRFSTYEEIEILDLAVLKKDGTRQPYNKDKIERGLSRALEKRGVASEQLKKLFSSIQKDIHKQSKDGVISTQKIGEIVLKWLKKTDAIAYIRFASVYKQFDDIDQFTKIISIIN